MYNQLKLIVPTLILVALAFAKPKSSFKQAEEVALHYSERISKPLTDFESKFVGRWDGKDPSRLLPKEWEILRFSDGTFVKVIVHSSYAFPNDYLYIGIWGVEGGEYYERDLESPAPRNGDFDNKTFRFKISKLNAKNISRVNRGNGFRTYESRVKKHYLDLWDEYKDHPKVKREGLLTVN